MKVWLLAVCMIVSAISFAAFPTAESGGNRQYEAPAKTIVATDLTVVQLQQLLGRKLTWKEKVQWQIAKKISRYLPPELDDATIAKQRSNALTGLILSGLGIILFPLLAIPGLIFSNQALTFEKQNPGALGKAKGYAQAGQIIGWIGIGMMILAILYVFFLLALLASKVH